MQPEQTATATGLDDEPALAHATRLFGLASTGRSIELGYRLDVGMSVNLTDEHGNTLLFLAAANGHPGTVAALLSRGADPDRVNDRGQTALAAATYRRCTESVTALLRAGADPCHGPVSALATAEFFDLPDMVELLRGHV